ncbi:MAG: bifunctional phosphopantothenoylcysteine decarboxylase/phosphopantothenate--cysteine ligase CoaBC [Dehalococcoidia bacterium]|nr:bifunctional phosphopantothenoylcysteine decarboxylase/phosphopantothenate--cysteine ligase CoaBC [Dehalococcoidia bacterium]MDW8120371.1 bifunctional phosphopantothenoylcysteine decarboxylase/phosphopantothenate--cysteine ligase CoaBC [Chloroflexota bacterium]
MPTVLHGKHIVLGVTGSIASFKAADLASKLVQHGALVDTVLTREACQFITPLTFQALTHRPVLTDLFDPRAETAMDHVALALRADLILVCPATAHTIARLSVGLTDDVLTTTALASRAPLVVVPAMDAHMYAHPVLQEHLERLQKRGVHVVGPVEGRLASGLVGKGRMAEVADILGHVRWVLGRATGDLRGYTIVATAGGTQEPIDPVRVVTNRSSGKMGYAVAEAARDRGARAILITAPTSLPDPAGVEVRRVTTALQMRDAVLEACREADALIMAAAVADYRPTRLAPQKIKKGPPLWTVELTRNPDIIAEVDGKVIKVGFAAETENLLANAREKLQAKGMHLIAANDVTAADSGFGAETNRVVLLDKEGGIEQLPLLPKYEVAQRILDRVKALLVQRTEQVQPSAR